MTRRICFIACLAVLLAAVPVASAAKGGPVPGPVWGWDGVRAPDGHVRYVALDGAANTTTVAAIRTRDGRVMRWARLKGQFGIPQVAFDGTADGVSADQHTLVLTTFPQYGATNPVTRLAVLRLPSLKTVKVIQLKGIWAFDAISPNGRTIVAAEFVSSDPNSQRYAVRAIDVARGAPYPGAILDARAPDERMAGQPITRAFGAGRTWAFTLYVRPSGTAFVHALDPVRRVAFCVDLPWRGVAEAIWAVRMTVDADGTLALRQRGKRLAAIDRSTWTVKTFARPTPPT